VERFDLGIWGGKQDPFACASGGLRFWRFEGDRVIEEPLRLPEWVEPELERSLALVYSGEAHLSGNIHNDILADYRKGDSRVKAAQHRLKEVALAAREALAAGDLERFAGLLNENWKAHQRLHESCATPRLHDLIARGLSSGALGAKVCGAGGGGCIVFLVFPEKRRALERAMIDAGARLLPLKLDRDGLKLWTRA
jgi:D-glycero-alpha-D-manno-heptose-7-phosphate kinase